MQLRHTTPRWDGSFQTDHVRVVLIYECVASTRLAHADIAAFFACPMSCRLFFWSNFSTLLLMLRRNKCVETRPSARPSMADVRAALEGKRALKWLSPPNRLVPFYIRFFGAINCFHRSDVSGVSGIYYLASFTNVFLTGRHEILAQMWQMSQYVVYSLFKKVRSITAAGGLWQAPQLRRSLSSAESDIW